MIIAETPLGLFHPALAPQDPRDEEPLQQSAGSALAQPVLPVQWDCFAAGDHEEVAGALPVQLGLQK